MSVAMKPHNAVDILNSKGRASVATYNYRCSYFTDSCHPDEVGAKFLRNVGSNRTRNLCVCSQELLTTRPQRWSKSDTPSVDTTVGDDVAATTNYGLLQEIAGRIDADKAKPSVPSVLFTDRTCFIPLTKRTRALTISSKHHM
jgi:hypothetical protein